MSSNTRGAIREMNEAFDGDQEVSYSAKIDKSDKLKVTKNVTKGPVIPLAEMPDADNDQALVPVDDSYEAKKKRRNDLIKMKAK